jgi:cell division protein FtsI (penicillin-binding protein 3)
MIEINEKIQVRSYIVIIGLFLFSFILIFKLIHIQFNEGEKYKNIAITNIIKNVVLEPSRGDIYSKEGNILATSIPRFELRWDATVISEKKFKIYKSSLADSLAAFLNVDNKIILDKIEKARLKKNRYFLVSKNLTYSEYQRIKRFPIFKLNSFRGGLIIEEQLVREHPMGKIAERTIGYEKKDVNGSFFRVGLEGAYSQYLRGDEGFRLKQKIANGQWKPINDNNEKEPTEGFDIHTTIDVNIQDIAHNSLLEQLEKFEAEHGVVVVMEVQTGEVRAIVNLGRTSKGKYFEKLNYAVGESHEPGSTFKLMAMVAALEDNVIDEMTLVNTDNGIVKFFKKFIVEDSKKGGYGIITSAKAFEVSSNVGLVKLINDNYKKNPKKFIDRLYNMGLNKPLGLAIKGEALPKIPYPTDKEWNGLTLPWMAYGYGISMTPLQTLTFYNAIANEGEMVKPRFIREISNLGNEPTKIFKTQILNPSICSKSTLKKVQKMMFNVVDKKWGTAYRIKDEFLAMAGKTGTCQTDYTTNDIQYISSFVGYFPANKPKYSSIVVIHRPNKSKGYYGSTVAAPVFKTIAKKIYNDTPKIITMSEKKMNFFLDSFPSKKYNNSNKKELLKNNTELELKSN